MVRLKVCSWIVILEVKFGEGVFNQNDYWGERLPWPGIGFEVPYFFGWRVPIFSHSFSGLQFQGLLIIGLPQLRSIYHLKKSYIQPDVVSKTAGPRPNKCWEKKFYVPGKLSCLEKKKTSSNWWFTGWSIFPIQSEDTSFSSLPTCWEPCALASPSTCTTVAYSVNLMHAMQARACTAASLTGW